MKTGKLEHTINLVNAIGYDFFVTLDGKVSPRIEASEKPAVISQKKLKINVWIDPEVVEQLTHERQVSLIILEENGKNVFKVAGHLDRLKKLGPAQEGRCAQANRLYNQQTLCELVISVESIEEVP